MSHELEGGELKAQSSELKAGPKTQKSLVIYAQCPINPNWVNGQSSDSAAATAAADSAAAVAASYGHKV
jgi:Asp-tRNA(Asn)/Glu-tRNA(Gln) amidotransferase A subunit family amidase